MPLRSAACGNSQKISSIPHAHWGPAPRAAPRRAPIARSGCNELPPELQDLRITEEGLLVDEKTGEVINEHGANRFDVVVRAQRGEFDPPPTADNTERGAGVLMDSLVQWPAPYDFQFVVRPGDAPAAAVAEELRGAVAAAAGADVPPAAVAVKERKGGKFLSITVTATVRYPELIQRVFAAFDGDARILMKY